MRCALPSSALGLSLLVVVVVAGVGAGCPAPVSGEGEGEGAAAEGEGEGEGGEGEGEGEGGEGEGEGEGGEGEGEGEGVVNDEAGDESNPLDIDLSTPFAATDAINPGDDHDCYRFTLSDSEVFSATTLTPNCNSDDTEVFLFDANNITTFLEHNDDGGPGLCSDLEVVLDPGTYILCLEEHGNNAVIDSVDLSLTAGAPVILNNGDPCIVGSIAAVCDTGGGADCVDDGTGNTICAVLNVLNPGDTCVVGDAINVCDATNGFTCLDDGQGNFTCENPSIAACAAAVEYQAPNVVLHMSGPNNVDGSCSFGEPEGIVHYLTTNHSQVIVQAFGADVLYLRSTCEVGASEIDCNDFQSNPKITLNDVAAGTDLFAFAETADGNDEIVLITERPILNEGDSCTATDVCDPSLALACQNGVCTAPSITVASGDLEDGDPTWTRFTSDCSASSSVEPFDRFTATNNSGVPVSATFATTTTGDPTTCPFDTVVAVLQSPSDPPSVTTAQCLGSDDDGGISPCSRVTLDLDVGESVDVVVSPFSTGRGVYDVSVTTFGGAVDIVAD